MRHLAACCSRANLYFRYLFERVARHGVGRKIEKIGSEEDLLFGGKHLQSWREMFEKLNSNLRRQSSTWRSISGMTIRPRGSS